MNKISQAYQVWKNMGTRYLWFRMTYEWKKRRGVLEKKFPTEAKAIAFEPLADWRAHSTKFFFEGRDSVFLPRELSPALEKRAQNILKGKVLFFHREWKTVNDWHTHPVTGHVYDANMHWSLIEDIDPLAGDIKYVWEKARFSFVYDIIRFDYHSGENHGEWVIEQIESWIDSNPLNKGPHYRCSQEISLRILNWIFALNFYKYSDCITEERWQKIHNSIYRQVQHVYENIDFSRIAVRNNHAITECLALYLVGLLFPFYPNSATMKSKGKAWLEEEVAYQIYNDGTYLQFSMNYHRVALQLLSWGMRLAELNKEYFSSTFYSRVRRSLRFLHTCQDEQTGALPNYGNNDGAWFFPLSETDYRDYKPLLNTLSCILDKKALYPETGPWTEDVAWYGFDVRRRERSNFTPKARTYFEIESFKKGGYYVYKETDSLTFIRCGAYKDRPGQADNLHLDLWVQGENILRDAGSYLYNTDEATTRYFAGTRGHNTVMLGDYDQMLKGPRFIWWYWNKEAAGAWKQEEHGFVFKGSISVYSYLGKAIKHRRKVTKLKDQWVWEVEDEILNKPADLPMLQLWHPSTKAFGKVKFTASDEQGNILEPSIEEGFYSSHYGVKETVKDIVYTTSGTKINTRIEWVL